MLIDMDTVTLSPKFQVVIPRAVRESLGLRPGERLLVVRQGGRVELIPMRAIKDLRGTLKGLDTSIGREDERL
jgi:AbrB family looped-hinge helix DNA binding protein